MKPTNECELATAVSSWLRGDGWSTYHEVPDAEEIDVEYADALEVVNALRRVLVR